MANRVRYHAKGPKLRAADLSRFQQIAGVGHALPADYRSFLAQHNGARISPEYFDYKKSNRTHTAFLERLFGVDTTPLFEEGRQLDAIEAVLRFRDELPRFSLPIGFVDRDDLLLIYLWGPRNGEVWVKSWPSEFASDLDAESPEHGTHFVSNSFRSFIDLLYPAVVD